VVTSVAGAASRLGIVATLLVSFEQSMIQPSDS